MLVRKQALGALMLALILLATAGSALAREPDGVFERTLTVTGAVDLRVGTRSGSITILRGEPGKVHIRGEILRRRDFVFPRGSSADVREVEENPPIEQQGNTIRITKLEGNLGRKLLIRYEITVPEETRVDADTGSGSIRVTGVQGPVAADTGSGSIKIEDIRAGARLDTGSGSIRATNVAGSFWADTGSGSIRAELLEASPVELSTGSGSIRVSGVQGELTAKTGSGSIRVEGAPTGDWTVRSGSGGITVRLPANSNFGLYARTSSGGIRTDFPVTVRGSFSKNKLEGKVGDGGPRMELRTSSGSIRIEEGGRSVQ